MNRSPGRWTRRQALTLAAGALALPFASIRRAHAATGRPPLRLLTVIDSYGMTLSHRSSTWIGSEVGDYALTEAALGTILQPLAAYRDQMLVMSGIDMVSRTETGDPATHGAITCQTLTGSRATNAESRARPGSAAVQAHASLDVHVGTYLHEDYGLTFPRVYPHLYLSDYAEPSKASFCFNQDGQQIRSIATADNIVNALFQQQDDSAAAQQLDLASRLAVLDLVGDRIRAVRGDLVNASAPATMDAYETSVREFGRELELRAGAACEPEMGKWAPGSTGAGHVGHTSEIFDSIFHALSCDLVSSITYAIGGEQINQLSHAGLYPDDLGDTDVRSWLGKNAHSLSHDSDEPAVKAQELIRIHQSEHLARLLDRLAATPDVDGASSVLDNTLVFVTSAMGGNVHGTHNIPHLLIAGANTALRGGHHYDCSDATNNDLLTTIAQGLTLPDTSFGGFREGERISSLNNGPISRMLRSAQ